MAKLMIEFLVKVMHGQQRPFIDKKQRIKPADRMAAAKELLNRGFGSFSSSRSRLSEKKDDYGTIHGDISQRIRQHTEYDSDITRFLLDVMAGQLHDDGFTMSHRVGAAKELLRRAYDINFDGVTWEQVEGYWRAQRPIGWNEEDERTLQNELAGSKPPLPLVEGRSEDAETPSPSASSHTIGEEPAHSESRAATGNVESSSIVSEEVPTESRDAHESKSASRRSRARRSRAHRTRESGNPERLAEGQRQNSGIRYRRQHSPGNTGNHMGTTRCCIKRRPRRRRARQREITRQRNWTQEDPANANETNRILRSA